MKKLALTIAVLLFALAPSDGVYAQTTKRLAATPKAFQVFYAKFRKAVLARDKAAIASVTRFPFKYGYDAGDEGTYSKTQFLRNFNKVFGERPPIFLARNPRFHVGEDGFDLVDESDASHYIFEKRGAGYQFTAYIAEP